MQLIYDPVVQDESRSLRYGQLEDPVPQRQLRWLVVVGAVAIKTGNRLLTRFFIDSDDDLAAVGA